MMIRHIALHELRTMFLSPLAWSILAVVQFILAWLFLSQLEQYINLQPQIAMLPAPPGIAEVVVAPLFGSAGIVLLLVVPLITMRLVSDERRARTLPLLFSAPVSMSQIVLGKYLGVMAFLSLMLGMIALMPLSLLLVGSLDLGQVAAGLLGLLLMLAAFAALGLYVSALTTQPTVAAVASFGALLLLWVINLAGNAVDDSVSSGLFAWLSLQQHFQSLLNGAFNSGDLAYYLLFICVFLVFTIRRLDADRLQN
ncbi:MAG: ABC transporter permease subunit [Thiohalomonadaceae bacterium]